MACMTLTIEHLPVAVNDALESKARAEGKSVTEVAVDVLSRALGVEPKAPVKRKRDLSRFRGTWVEDPEFDKAMELFETIDEDPLA